MQLFLQAETKQYINHSVPYFLLYRIVSLSRDRGGGGGGELWKGVPFTGFRNIGISSFEAYERVGNLSFRTIKDQKGPTDAFCRCERDRKSSRFSDSFSCKRQCIYSS